VAGRVRQAKRLSLGRQELDGGPNWQANPWVGSQLEPYQYTQFCECYHRWRGRLDLVMRQTHRAGEKIFIDYSGKKPHIVDASTGEVIDVELFVMVLGASNYTYAEVTRTQQVGDFIDSLVRGLEYFGGVSEVLVPDQLRSAVTGPDRYDPDINATLLDFAKPAFHVPGLLSYLLFDGEFAGQLIEIGRADARAHHDALCQLVDETFTQQRRLTRVG
jgi:hypothetical protein